MVSRESLVYYETNRYSVPPQYIGTTIKMLIQPLHRTVDMMGPEGLLRWRAPRTKAIRSCVDAKISAPSVYDALLSADYVAPYQAPKKEGPIELLIGPFP